MTSKVPSNTEKNKYGSPILLNPMFEIPSELSWGIQKHRKQYNLVLSWVWSQPNWSSNLIAFMQHELRYLNFIYLSCKK